MLEVKNLTGYYGSKCAVDHISFHLERGQVLGFLGINGAGKSTTMNMLTGYLEPMEGQVLVDGISLWDHPVRAKEKIGYLPEKPPLYPDMTVEEYLGFLFSLKKVRLPRKQHIGELCERLGLTGVRKKLLKTLSKGYGQRVGIAQALLGYPPLVILDEPTVGLDPAQIAEVSSLLRETGKDSAVILSSHILAQVQAVCDRILVLHQGKIIRDGTTEELAREDTGMFYVEILGDRQRALAILANTSCVEEVVLKEQKRDGACVYRVTVEPGYISHTGLLGSLLEEGLQVRNLYWGRKDLETTFLSLLAGNGEGGRGAW